MAVRIEAPHSSAEMSSKRYQREAPGKKRQRQSVASLVKTSVQGQKKSQRKPSAKSRSFAPSPLAQFERQQEARGVKGEDYVAGLTFFDSDKATSPSSLCLLPALDSGPRGPIIRKRTATTNRSSSRRGKEDTVDGKKPKGFKVERKPKEGDRDGDNIPDWLEDLYDNSDRHAVGMGLLQRIFGSGSGKRDIDFKEDRDSRPFFTYWVTIIQIIIFIVCIATYGVAPIGIDKVLNSENVLMTTLAIEQVSVLEETNMWIGLRQDDLIHVGAKYSPCMRVDANLEAVLAEDRALDNQTACCIYNDGSGCVQTLEKDCSVSAG